MLKFLMYTKGQLSWHSWGCWTESLSTVRKRFDFAFKRGLSSDSVLVLESKSPCECVYRLRKLVDGKWVRSSWIDLSDDSFSEIIYKYTEAFMDDYIKFRSLMLEEDGEIYSISEWALRNDSSIREIIFWMYNNGLFTFDTV